MRAGVDTRPYVHSSHITPVGATVHSRPHVPSPSQGEASLRVRVRVEAGNVKAAAAGTKVPALHSGWRYPPCPAVFSR